MATATFCACCILEQDAAQPQQGLCQQLAVHWNSWQHRQQHSPLCKIRWFKTALKMKGVWKCIGTFQIDHETNTEVLNLANERVPTSHKNRDLSEDRPPKKWQTAHYRHFLVNAQQQDELLSRISSCQRMRLLCHPS